MEETIQCLPQELRTLHPKTLRWSTENVSGWVTIVTSWGLGGEEGEGEGVV